jgi:hypothetical protein
MVVNARPQAIRELDFADQCSAAIAQGVPRDGSYMVLNSHTHACSSKPRPSRKT